MFKTKLLLSDSTNWHIFIILAFSVLVISPVFMFGMPYGSSDFNHHIQLAIAYFDGLGQGIWYPNWVFNENNGYGAVTVRFYPPLTQYVVAICRLISGTWFNALFLSLAFWSFVGGSGLYLWAKEIFQNKWQALIATLLFIIAPYHLNQFYNALMLAEFVALAIIPFCFFYARRVCLYERLADILGFGVSFAFLFLSNLPQSIIGAICVGIYILFYLEKKRIFSQVAKLCCGSVLALLCSSFYWVRMVNEVQWLNVFQPNTIPSYDYRNNFLLSSLELDTHSIWFASLMFVFLWVCVIAAILVTEKFRTVLKNVEIRNIFAVFSCASFMLLPFSKLVWANITFLQRVQFPWRFMSIVTLSSCLIIAYCFRFLTLENYRKQRPFILIFIGIILIYSSFSIKQIICNAAYMKPTTFAEWVESLHTANGLEHWWTIWTKESAFKENRKVIAENREVEIKKWETENRDFIIAAGEPTEARIACLYYPNWKAFINGNQVEIQPSDDGAISINLPAEKSEVELSFIEPNASLYSRKFALVGWLAVFFLYLYQFLFLRKKYRIQ